MDLATPAPTPDIDAVTRLLADVSRELVLPKFRALRDDEIHPKPTDGNADDLVTVVDRHVETHLTRSLLGLMPAARVIGEEAAHTTPDLLALIDHDDPVWIIDPLDGTSNFASGSDAFGVMVGFALRGHIRAAWIHLPVRDEMFVAEAGAGVFCNGQRLQVPRTRNGEPMRGTFFTRYMPAELRGVVTASTAHKFVPVPNAGAAAIEYTEVLRGRKEFAVYYRLLPWDHGAPALILTEGGGCVEHLDGQPYTIRSVNQLTFVARDGDVTNHLRAWLRPELGGGRDREGGDQ